MSELDTPKTTSFHPLRVWLHDHGSWLLALLALLTLGLGTLGFRQYYVTLGQTPTWQDLLYAALRLFNLESGQVDGALPWMLEVARWLAPLVLLAGGTAAGGLDARRIAR